MQYTTLACLAYERFKGQENVFYINHEVDLENRLEIKEINEWIKTKSRILVTV